MRKTEAIMNIAIKDNIIPNLEEKIKEAVEKERRVYPCRSNRASQIGHPCERYLVYKRTQWEKETPPSLDKLFIFNGGNLIEKMALQYLEKAGFSVLSQQRDFEDKRLGITGHIDGFLLDPATGKKFPLEIKGISPYEFDKINAIEDFLYSRRYYMRAYPAQLQLYLYLSEYEHGLFLLINKLTYQPKAIWCQLDYDFVENLLKKVERVNKHIEQNTLPERIDDYDICSQCSFAHICLPSLKHKEGIEIVDNAELEEKIDRLQELRDVVKEYKTIENEIKKYEGKEIAVGKYLITGKWVVREIPPQPQRTIKFWQRKIIRLE